MANAEHLRILKEGVEAMKKRRFTIEDRDLAATSTTELRSIAHYAHRVSEIVAEANIESDVESLADLEAAVEHEIAAIGGVLLRVERRVAKELATRN